MSTRVRKSRSLPVAKSYFASARARRLSVIHHQFLEPSNCAAAYGFQDIIESLLDKGAKIDGRDDIYDFTPLHYTARFGTIEVAEVLIAHGADIKAMDKWDYQPIHCNLGQ